VTDAGPPGALISPPGRQGPGPIPAARVEALDLVMARRASGVLPGDRPAPGTGTGTELAQLRPYQPGDDVRRLDPAATARTGIPHVRLQVPERLLTTWIALDVSASMAFGSEGRLKSDVAEGVAMVLGRLGTRRGGRVALVTCGAPATRVLPPKGGRGALATLRRAVAEGVAADRQGGPGLDDALARIGRMATHPGLVAVVSDFRDGEDWTAAMRRLTVRHSVLAVEVSDPREGALPAVGRLALVDPESGRQVEVNTSSARLRSAYAGAERDRREAVARSLRRAGAEHVRVTTDGPWLRELGRRLA
jgi:uncharacterized protein (DUF58 family)